MWMAHQRAHQSHRLLQTFSPFLPLGAARCSQRHSQCCSQRRSQNLSQGSLIVLGQHKAGQARPVCRHHPASKHHLTL